MKLPSLKVIAGGGLIGTPWTDFPDVVQARSPADRDQHVLFRVARTDIEKALRANRRQPAFDMWSALFGCPPPVPNVETPKAGLTSLMDAHACFEGVRRPWAEDDNGERCLAYILKPEFLYRYEPSLVRVAKMVAVPGDLVYVAHIRLDLPHEAQPPATRGVFTHGAWVEVDPNDPLLPMDHASRYTARRW